MKILQLILHAVGRAASAKSGRLRFGKLLFLLSNLLVTSITAAPPPTDWQWLLPSQAIPGGSMDEVAYGNGTFVGVGGYGAVATSPDGLNWEPVLPGTSDYLGSVAFGSGTFVVVGGVGISTSTDGVTWEHHAGLGDEIALYRVRFVGNLFVAMGQEYLTNGTQAGVLYTSSNGLEWTQRLRLIATGNLQTIYPGGIARGNGRFVAAWSETDDNSPSKGFTYTSSDGIQWTRAAANPLLGGPAGLTFGDVGFVLLDENRILTSADGAAWQVRHQLDESWYWRDHGIASVGNRIVCLAEQNVDTNLRPGFALTSDDGISWQQSPLSDAVRRLLFSNGTNFFAVAEKSALTSSDGGTWTEHFTPHPLDAKVPSLWDIAYGHRGFIAVGSAGAILASVEGTTWEKRTSDTGQILSHVIHGDGRYVAAGENGTLIHSTDGQAWTAADLDGNTLSLGPLAHGAGRFVLITRTGGNGFFWTSEDGIDWQVRFSDALVFFSGASAMAFGNGRFVVAGRDDNVVLSQDGITWQRVILPDAYKNHWIKTILFDGNRFLADSYNLGLLASTDGQYWTLLDEISEQLIAIGHGDGNLVAVLGTQRNLWEPVIGLLQSSTNGTSWTIAAPFLFDTSWLKFAYGAGRFVGVGIDFNHSIRIGDDWHSTAKLLISGYTPSLLLPQVALRNEAGKFLLRLGGEPGSDWNLQQSSTLDDWQTIRTVTLGAEPLNIEVAPTAEAQGFWRLSAPTQ